MFGNKGDLERHVKIIHEKIKSYICKSCEKNFGKQSDLGKAYKCNSCERSFGVKGSLKGNLKTVHGKRRDFSCDVCCKKLSSNFILKKHIQIFHTNIKSKSTGNKTSLKIQQGEENSNAITKVKNPKFDTILPKLEISDSKSIVKCQLSEEYFSHEN